MSLKNFYSELTKGFPSPIYLISSSDDFLLYECLTLIKENRKESDPLNFSLHDLDPSDGGASVKQIVAEFNTLPFFGEKRTVILKNIQKTPKKDIKKLAEYLLNPSDFTLLIMLCTGEYKKIFDPEALKKTRIISIQSVNLPLWIQEKAKRKGLAISTEAIEYLIGTAGEDLTVLNSEIHKLSLLGAKKIDIADIKEIVYAGAEFSAFDLTKALQRRDAKSIFRIYYCLEKNTDPLVILGALNWHYRRQYDKAERNKKAKYLDIFKLIHEADVAQKSSTTNAVENLLIRILQLGREV
jgi:DNA polymerase-3 subunit delta